MNEDDHETVYKAKAYIKIRIKNQIRVLVDEVSKYVGYSSKQLNRKFKDVLGMSVAKYIKTIRIDLGVKAIARGSDIIFAADNVHLSQSSLSNGVKKNFGMLAKNLKNGKYINSIQNTGKVISIGFSTGGAGASTLSLIAGAYLAQNNKVLIVDASPIGSTSFALMGKSLKRSGLCQLIDLNLDSKIFYQLANFGLLGAMIDENPRKYITELSSNFHLLPNDGYLDCCLPRFLYDDKMQIRIDVDSFKRMIEKLRNDYDYIIVDTHYAGLYEISNFVIRSSDHILMPLFVDAFSISRLGRSLKLIKEQGLDKSHVTAVFRRDYEVGKVGLAFEDEVKKQYGQILFKSYLPNSENARKVAYGYEDLIDGVKKDRVPCQYYVLINEVCGRLVQQ